MKTLVVLVAASLLAGTSAMAAPSGHGRHHRAKHMRMMKASPTMARGTAATSKQMRDAPASPVGGPVGSGKP